MPEVVVLKLQCTCDLNLFNLSQVKQRIEELQKQTGTPEVVVVGGGYAGIELASVAAEMLAGQPQLSMSIYIEDRPRTYGIVLQC